MKAIDIFKSINFFIVALVLSAACDSSTNETKETITKTSDDAGIGEMTVVLGDSSLSKGEYVDFNLDVKKAGRYRVTLMAQEESEVSSAWIEDYVGNVDGRTYDITGKFTISDPNEPESVIEGSPLNVGTHKMRLHISNGQIKASQIKFSLMREHKASTEIMEQNTNGGEWKVVWADEFDGESIDTSKWTFDIGNWGWGNNELQYYTDNRAENARIEDGALVIEARKNDMGEDWTSARLTTRGKVAFLHGKIELKAIVPRERGNWAAGWTLGNSYVDELSWPYCGEIDILESVGYEVNNETGDGIAHATVHTPAYYFKINNQISATKEVEDIADEWHTYSVEWTPTEIKGFVDGEQYYLYDENADEKEWPFFDPQNIILNLAMGGGWGGAQGVDSTIVSQKFVVDYVRVYGK